MLRKTAVLFIKTTVTAVCSLLGYWVVELERDNSPATNLHLAHGRGFRSFYKTFAAVLKQSTVVFHINKSFFLI